MNQAMWQTVCNLGAAVVERGDPAWPPLWSGICPVLCAWLASPRFRAALHIAPHTAEIISNRNLGPPEQSHEGDQEELLIQVWEELQQDRYHKLHAFFAFARPPEARPPAFREWLYLVLQNAAIGRLRARPTKEMAAALALWRSQAAGHKAAGHKSGKWRRQEARQTFDTHGGEMLEFLDESVPRFQRDAVTLANVGMGASEIAAHLGLPSPAAAALAVSRGRERLMYRRALELWSQGHSDEDIAAALTLGDVAQAERLIHAATEFLRRHFSG